MKRIILIVSIVFLGILALQAQNTCADQLRLAQRRFDDGLLDEIPQLIVGCMKSGFTSEEKTNAYKLLIQTYLFNEQPEKADEVMLQFLGEFSGYTLAANDPKEFINLYKTYRTDPIFKIEINVSGNYCLTPVVENYGPYNFNQIEPKYSPLPGFHAGINYVSTIYKELDYSIGATFSLLRYSYSNKPDITSVLTGISSNYYLGLPVGVRYSFKLKGINMIAKAGVEAAYLLSSKMNLTREPTGAGEPVIGTLDLTPYHKSLDIKPFISVGVNMKIRNIQLLVMAGMKFGTIVPLKNDTRLKDWDNYTKYSFQEDRYFLHQPFVTISYFRSIYNPKKIL